MESLPLKMDLKTDYIGKYSAAAVTKHWFLATLFLKKPPSEIFISCGRCLKGGKLEAMYFCHWLQTFFTKPIFFATRLKLRTSDKEVL